MLSTESHEIIHFLRLWRISDGPATSHIQHFAYTMTKMAIDYVNLNNVDNTDNFQEMFVRACSVDEGIYRKILLRVSELDSPVVLRFMPQN